jgi:hemerythrin
MELFTWTNDLTTNDESIDLQHKKIFNYLNILIAAENDPVTRQQTIRNTVDGLIEYTLIHFEEEEIVMKKNGYPDLLRHQKLHSDFTQNILEFKERLDNGEELLHILILVIKNWLVVHIKQEDMKALK